MPDSEAKTAVGSRVAISEKGDWTTFEIDVGTQYPLRLSTKVKAVVDQARDHGTGPGLWHWNESQGNPNPNKPGTYYTNRYLSKVEPVEETGPPAATAGGTAAPVDWDNKERRDYRSRAWAQTLAAFQHTITPADDPEHVFLRLQPFQRRIYNDVCQSFAYPAEEDDIPF